MMMHRKRHGRIGTVNRAGGSKNEMLYAVVPAAFQEIYKSNEIGINVSIRIFDRVSDPRLGGHVHNRIKRLPGKKPFQWLAVRQVHFDEYKIRFAFKRFKTGLFKRNVVIWVNIVNAHHPSTVF